MPTQHNQKNSLLSYLRHELSTPINIIIGYSELLLEGIATQDEVGIYSELQSIHSCGKELLSLLTTILAPEKRKATHSDQDIAILIETLRIELQAPIKIIISYCENLLAQATREIAFDLGKIHTAAKDLLTMSNKIVSLSKQQLNLAKVEQQEILELPAKKISDIATANSIEDDQSEEQVANQGNILVVDDNENNRDLLSRQIEAQGYTVSSAANGLQVLQMIQSGQYDLILLDIIMPEMNGYEVLQWLRDNGWRHIPVIMISALDELDSVVKCIEMGAEDYLPKPFNPVLLRARIDACLEKKKLRDQETLYLTQLSQANQEITILNERLKAENLRLSAELEITRRLQQMILPREQELSQIKGLEIAGFMEPADEVGGDYYDVLQHDGQVKIGIGDVTGHGLESGVLMIMVQTAVRTLMENDETDPKKFLDVINRTIYKNVQRMGSDKNLTLSLVNYQKGQLSLSGQHEEIIVVRSQGKIELIDTLDLGFPLGLEETITDFIAQIQIKLNSGDGVVLYTDGITEAENSVGLQYGLERLCKIVSQNWQYPASKIKELVIDDLRQHIGKNKIYDDITLLVMKQKS